MRNRARTPNPMMGRGWGVRAFSLLLAWLAASLALVALGYAPFLVSALFAVSFVVSPPSISSGAGGDGGAAQFAMTAMSGALTNFSS